MKLFGVKVIADSDFEWLSLEEARQHCKVDAYGSPAEHPDDALLTRLITVSRELSEVFTGLSLRQKTLEVPLSAFPWSYDIGIELPYGPVNNILSISYPGDGVTATMDDYQIDEFTSPFQLYPASGAQWPTIATPTVNGVRIRYTTGYSHPLDSPSPYPLPESIKQAMLLAIAYFYVNRGDSDLLGDIPLAAKSLLRGYRVETSMG